MTQQNKKILHAKEYVFLYETKFDKFLKYTKLYSPYAIAIVAFITALISNFNFLTTAIITFIVFVLSVFLGILYEDKTKNFEVIGVHGTKDKYFFQIGTAVTSIKDVWNPAKVAKKWDWYVKKGILLYPILIEEKQALTHMFVVGTTGAGKTTFLVNILQQVIMLGGGAMAIDGKGDKDVYEAFYNTAVDCGREDDFLVINFNVPKESNRFNPLLKGNEDEITDIIGNMLDTSGDNAFWSGRAITAMKALLSILVPLRDMGLLWTSDNKKVHILTFSVLNEWLGDLQSLKTLYFTIKRSNELGYLDKLDIFTEEEVQKYKPINYKRLQNYLASVYLNIHDESAEIEESSSKQHGNSYLMWNEPLDLLGGRFGAIFDTDAPDIDMGDIVTNGRIIYVLLPALKVDPRSLSSLGKIILSLFKNAVAILLGEKISGTIEVRYQASARRPRVPFWGVMDEYGAYAVEGFDNVLAQARSLRISVAILVQEIASLKKTSEIEAQRLLGNTGIKIALKIEEQKTAEEIVEMLGKSEEALLKLDSEQTASDERRFDVQEKEKVRIEELKMLKPGHGYIMWAGQIQPMLVRYYDPPIAPEIPEFNLVQQNIYPYYKIDEDKEKIIKNYQGTEEIKAVLTTEEKADLINKEFQKRIYALNSGDTNEVKEINVKKVQERFNTTEEIIKNLAKLVEEKEDYKEDYLENFQEDLNELNNIIEDKLEELVEENNGEYNISIDVNKDNLSENNNKEDFFYDDNDKETQSS